ncbi:MAG: diacylglycerol kinase family protein [Pseudomonadota bacterium]
MSTLGVIRNPASSANRSGVGLVAPPEAVVASPASREATGEAVRSLLAAGVQRIAVDGGDGTVRLVVDALLREQAAERVALILLRRGNTNLFCREIGGWGSRLPEDAGGGLVVARRLLRVRNAGCDRHGLIFGLGAYERATRLSAERRGPLGAAGVASAGGRALWDDVLQGPEGPWRRGVPLDVSVDGVAAPAGPRLLFAATAAEGRLPLGLDPFGREGQGPVRWLDIDAPGRRLAVAAPLVLSGRHRPWLERAGYRRGRAEMIELGGVGSFVLDGDVIACGPDATLTIEPSLPVRFQVPEASARERVPAERLGSPRRIL